jgi:hypothetical protein
MAIYDHPDGSDFVGTLAVVAAELLQSGRELLQNLQKEHQ